MPEPALFVGPALRRLRRRTGLTQAAMAQRLQISPSYLNLIERNQRPVTARVVMQLMSEFAFDPRELAGPQAVGGVDGLARRLADERFADLAIDREEIDDFLSASPALATAFARLYDAAPGVAEEAADPLTAARREIERWRNHFADLDHGCEALADELRLSRGDTAVALSERLREKHQLSVRILPREVMPEARRRLDLHARQVQLAEMLGPEARAFELAAQIAMLEQREAIGQVVAGSQLGDGARDLFTRHLESYCAAALLMPYGRFLRACEASGYDLPVLQRRFGVSFEQLAHRLTTLQRVGQRGLPFFMARIDRAGQMSKRFAGASGATFLESGQPCPLWCAAHAFDRPGELLVQTVALDQSGPSGAHYFCVAQAVATAAGARFAVVLGLEAELAGTIAQARGVSLARETATAIGPGCRLCHVEGCPQRAFPPVGARLAFDRTSRPLTPFGPGASPPPPRN
jgi:XRE family transcriptional regulator, fatty acid utilization regulator